MRGYRIAAAGLTAALALTACSQSTVTTEDAYKIGCPAIDATAASGSVAHDVAVSTLEQVRDSGHPSPQTRKWLNAAIELLTSDEPGKLSRPAKRLIIQGCKHNGYPLQNLK